MIFALFTALVLPAQAARSEVYTENAMSPDSSLFYTADDLYQAAQAYGAEGRAAYVKSRFTFDSIWPLVYAAFLGTGISWLYKRAFRESSAWQLANLAPLLGALLDYLENLSTSIVMVLYPTRAFVIGAMAPILTLLKWVLIGSSFGLLMLGIAVALWRRTQGTPT